MKVKATRMGYYDHQRRRPGDVFELHEDELPDWVERVDAHVAPASYDKRPYTRKPRTDDDVI